MSRPAVQRLLQFSTFLSSKQSDILTSGLRNDLSRAFRTSTQDSTSSQKLGFATASLVGLSAGCLAFATASSSDVETATIGDIKVTASGGARIRREVVFVLGGPGSGKGTQCTRLVSDFKDIAHFSAGDLLRELVKSGTPEGDMVANMIKEGKIVPSEVTINLLQKAMAASGKTRILIDGFPRNMENRDNFERVAGYDCTMVLFFDCPEEVMEKRLLGRNQGRTDDNIETIRKRFKVFLQSTLPVIEYYEKLGKVQRIIADRPPEAVYAEVRSLFA